jgi:hypothetical protein
MLGLELATLQVFAMKISHYSTIHKLKPQRTSNLQDFTVLTNVIMPGVNPRLTTARKPWENSQYSLL